MRPLLSILAVTVGLAGGYFYFTHAGQSAIDAKSAGRPQMLPAVTITTPQRDTVADTIEALGTAYAQESVNVTAPASDTLVSLSFTDGQAVRKGDTLAVLEQDEEKAELSAAEAQLADDTREVARLDGLVRQNAAPVRDLDTRRTAQNITRQQIAGIKARINDRVIRAPFDGIVGLRDLSVGALISAGDTIATIDDISRIKADFTVPSIHLSVMKTGTPIVAMTDAVPGVSFEGVIESIDARIDPVTRSMRVRAIIDNPDALLRPGLLLKISVAANAREALTVPEESVIQRGSKHFLIVLDETGKAAETEITIGTRRPGILEVTGGVDETTRFIHRGSASVRPGMTFPPETLKTAHNTSALPAAENTEPPAAATTDTATPAPAATP